jgi:hypothetical protein
VRKKFRRIRVAIGMLRLASSLRIVKAPTVPRRPPRGSPDGSTGDLDRDVAEAAHDPRVSQEHDDAVDDV